MKPLPAILLLLCIAQAGYCGDTLHRINNVAIVDGDTIRVGVVRLPWNAALVDQNVRLTGYDAWESSKRRQSVKVTDEEVERGKAATKELASLLDGADAMYLASGDRHFDSYGRLLGRLFVRKGDELVDVASWLRQRGHDRNVDATGQPR